MGMLWFARKHAPGQAPLVTGKLERLKQRLQDPQGFHSYGQIQQWLATELKLNIAYKTVYQLVRYRLNAKLKFLVLKALNNIQKVSLTLKNFPRSNSCSRIW